MIDISKNYIASLIPKGSFIIDVGAYDGKDAAELSAACESVVHCFEPFPESRQLIVDRKDPMLFIWPYALGAYNGVSMMNVAREHHQSNTLKLPKEHKNVWPEIKYKTSIKINITTLDNWRMSWAADNGDRNVDFIWCDVNGSEGDFLIGAAQTLAITKYLYIEFCNKELFAKCLGKEQLIKALPGFEVLGVFNEGPNYGNLLFKNKNEGLWLPTGQQ